MKAEILDTDAVALMAKAKGPEAGEHMAAMMKGMQALDLKEAQDNMRNKMVMKARGSLMEKLVVMLPNQLAEAAGAKIEMNALSEKDDAEWFFRFLEDHG